MKIIKTNEYHKFKFDKSQNRKTNQGLINKLIKSIEEKNLLSDCPILVKKQDDHFLILDGQNRFEAAKYMNIDFYYIISENTDFTDVPNLQNIRRSWKPIDYIDIYVNQRNSDYIYLKSMLRAGYGITTALAICFYAVSPKKEMYSNLIIGEVKTGKFKADIMKIDKILTLLESFKKFKHYKDRAFVVAILTMMKNKDYDHDQMNQKMAYTAIERRVCKDDYIKQMEEIYNYKSRVKIRFI